MVSVEILAQLLCCCQANGIEQAGQNADLLAAIADINAPRTLESFGFDLAAGAAVLPTGAIHTWTVSVTAGEVTVVTDNGTITILAGEDRTFRGNSSANLSFTGVTITGDPAADYTLHGEAYT